MKQDPKKGPYFRELPIGFRVWGLELRVQGQGLGFRVLGFSHPKLESQPLEGQQGDEIEEEPGPRELRGAEPEGIKGVRVEGLGFRV